MASLRENPFHKIYRGDEFLRVLRYRDNPSLFPFIVDIELTNYCNLKCLFCGQQDMKRPKGFMSKKIFYKIIKECSEFNTPIRLIRWGEPFLHPKIIEFIKYAKNKKLLVHLTTNGLAFKEGQIEELAKSGLDSLIFSMQGATPKRYEEMRNNDRYNEFVANVKKFMELRDNTFVHISSTMTNETDNQIKRFTNYWGEIVDSVGVGKTNLSRVAVSSSLKKKETIKKCYKPCTEVYQKLSVDWDGKVSCCCADWDNFMTVGDLNKQTLEYIWNNSPSLKAYRQILDEMKHKSLSLCSVCYKPYDF